MYFNELEFMLVTSYLILLVVSSLILNGLVIYLTRKHTQLQEARMFVRVAYAIYDILFAIGTAMHYIIILHFQHIPVWIKCTTGTFMLALLFGTAQLTAFIALERYFYFCKPMVYGRLFNLRFISIATVIIFTITQLYVFLIEIIFDA